ncbi:Hypothetical protein POVR2_LOCUS371 [uncultured virus]|nr:Hypothetical protein POVR2_LOCUS371 [uncultured virus]
MRAMGYLPQKSDMMNCCIHGFENIMSYLLRDGTIDPSALRYDGSTYHALVLAIAYYQPTIVRLLVADPRVDPAAMTYPIWGCNLLEATRKILSREHTINDLAIRRQGKVIKILLEDGRIAPNT